MRQDKKGISPVIATVLLIMLAIILAVIILIWVKSFIGEQVTKDLGSGPEIIDSFCKEISFEVDASLAGTDLLVTAQNNGNVPIYGFEVRKKGTFSVKKIADLHFDDETLLSGDTKDATTTIDATTTGKLLFVPVLLGQADSGKKYYTCDDEFGEEIEIA